MKLTNLTYIKSIPEISALIGDSNGNIDAGGGMIFCRLIDGKVIEVQNWTDIPLMLNSRVVIQKDVYGVWMICRPYPHHAHHRLSESDKLVFEKCSYCRSQWIPDTRGNCTACGAPPKA